LEDEPYHNHIDGTRDRYRIIVFNDKLLEISIVAVSIVHSFSLIV